VKDDSLMKLSFVDRNAALGSSFLHNAQAESKMVAALFLLITVLAAGRLELLAFLMVGLATLLLFTGTRMAEQAVFLLYPLFFGGIFGGVLLGYRGAALALVLLRACAAVFVLLLLITTTPYIRLFAVLGRFLPVVLVDIMFLTYRSFFIITGQIQDTITAVRLKGGYDLRSLAQSIKNAARILGFTLLTSLEMNEKNYRILLLRGYEGGIMPVRERFTWGHQDILPVACSSIFLVLAVLW
jgi:cobalt/nickel transport system permease protein